MRKRMQRMQLGLVLGLLLAIVQVARQAQAAPTDSLRQARAARRDSLWQDIRQNGIPQLSWEKRRLKASLNLYLDLYYTFDLGQPRDRNRPYFYASRRHNEFMVNVGLVDAQVNYADRVRTRLAVGYGSYFRYNYAQEPGEYRFLYEASLGIRLAEGLWLDGGILASPFGYEGAISMQQPNYTRSLSADNTPYFLTGARISYSPTPKWTLNGYVVNGWQVIESRKPTPSGVWQVQHRPTDSWLLNYTGYFGDERRQDTLPNRWRQYNDFYAVYTPHDRMTLVLLFDIGTERTPSATSAAEWQLWHTANVCFNYRVGRKVALGLRAEYYRDKGQAHVPSVDPTRAGFSAYGGSVNVDIRPLPNALIRAEVRSLAAEDRIFPAPGGGLRRWMTAFTLSMGISI